MIPNILLIFQLIHRLVVRCWDSSRKRSRKKEKKAEMKMAWLYIFLCCWSFAIAFHWFFYLIFQWEKSTFLFDFFLRYLPIIFEYKSIEYIKRKNFLSTEREKNESNAKTLSAHQSVFSRNSWNWLKYKNVEKMRQKKWKESTWHEKNEANENEEKKISK